MAAGRMGAAWPRPSLHAWLPAYFSPALCASCRAQLLDGIAGIPGMSEIHPASLFLEGEQAGGNVRESGGGSRLLPLLSYLGFSEAQVARFDPQNKAAEAQVAQFGPQSKAEVTAQQQVPCQL